MPRPSNREQPHSRHRSIVLRIAGLKKGQVPQCARGVSSASRCTGPPSTSPCGNTAPLLLCPARPSPRLRLRSCRSRRGHAENSGLPRTPEYSTRRQIHRRQPARFEKLWRCTRRETATRSAIGAIVESEANSDLRWYTFEESPSFL